MHNVLPCFFFSISAGAWKCDRVPSSC